MRQREGKGGVGIEVDGDHVSVPSVPPSFTLPQHCSRATGLAEDSSLIQTRKIKQLLAGATAAAAE